MVNKAVNDMFFKLKITVLISSLLIALTGCNDPKKANEDKFKVAAQQYLDTKYANCYSKANFPMKTDGFYFDNLPGMLHVMAEKGLLSIYGY
ncbi:hypothetical protein JMY81_15245 [Brenneria goodwinii]|uniref:hypothetical protein n=1 Tax=Brenneria goodwinii TaxID=1109412 RepID=UPI000EF1E1AE|nr:hypothetical protein [Brenneria goodwinii]MCG8156461.1 hypothetical protein [Brenneria goodwinii]MCG8162168.1 hypothetical protein [Brenneria goodwinii]MCG8166790.1 hypothetical protein [Brenneria goodwinii]MCG8171440.1 hypothetical protein [Brenneria goodwinii]MCG8175138.1 hypothetical protein [Brenneria goodwinii]